MKGAGPWIALGSLRVTGAKVVEIHFKEVPGSSGGQLIVTYAEGVTQEEGLAALRLLRSRLIEYLPDEAGGSKPRRRIQFLEE